MTSGRQLGSRSSLFLHTFPPFYACYLLKSIETPKSKATYIGSTPSPPRRIRQHNGEIAQGASKTRQRRPWAMQMIVHGFPSRLAALQFEWAWQHPHKSRHLRDSTGKAIFTADRRPKHVNANIRIVHSMISNHPYNTWPLHVKLFTEEAVKGWSEANSGLEVSQMPAGFTCSIELEGVDGKSGKRGSGRQGPISVNDEEFTSAYLAKNTALLATNHRLTCSVCNGHLTNYATDPLTTALCPQPACTAVSHLMCLSNQFLASHNNDRGLIPRGGSCSSCHRYTLWGDIVRGCYRRMAGTICEPREDVPNDEGEMYHSDIDQAPTFATLPAEEKFGASKHLSIKSCKRREKMTGSHSSDGESFDLDVSSTDELFDTPRTRASLRNISPALSSKPPIVNSSSIRALRMKPQQCEQPRKAHNTRIPSSPLMQPTPKKPKSVSKGPIAPKNHYSTSAPLSIDSSDSGESFDFDAISSDSSDIIWKATMTPRRMEAATATGSSIQSSSPGKFNRKDQLELKGKETFSPPGDNSYDASISESKLVHAISSLSISAASGENKYKTRFHNDTRY